MVAFFAAYTHTWRESETFYTRSTVGYEMPAKRSMHIGEGWELELIRGLTEQ